MKKRMLVTGCGGLIGSEACRYFLERGFEVLGVDNNLRRYFFGKGGDTQMNVQALARRFPAIFTNHSFDLRDRKRVLQFVKQNSPLELIVHTAAQPSHDWAAREPFTDFDVNAVATLNLLEAFRQFSPGGVFIFTSTNKVYGDNPNKVPLKELEKRWEYDLDGKFEKPELRAGVSERGVNEKMSLDDCKHSLFGASKVSADVLCQEYGKYFGLNVGVFRGGCLTGPQHSAVELHGFLAYIIDCAVKNGPYRVLGYKGKQVRDQIHSFDVVSAFEHFFQNPKKGVVYNLGGCKENSASILEVIDLLKEEHGLSLDWRYEEKNREGDHVCYYSDMSKFRTDYPNWRISKSLNEIVRETVERKR